MMIEGAYGNDGLRPKGRFMGLIWRGMVKGGSIVFSEPLALPEGTDVIVHVEPATVTGADPVEDFASLPFFGMWAERGDVTDGAEWVREERERWHRRASR